MGVFEVFFANNIRRIINMMRKYYPLFLIDLTGSPVYRDQSQVKVLFYTNSIVYYRL